MDLRVWQTLAGPEHEELVRLAMETDPRDVAAVARLRKACADVELVRAALTLGEARRKAIGKFGRARAATLWADPAGVEMATSAVVGAYKWSAVAAIWRGGTAMDVCCGIGGDAMAIARASAGHVRVVGVDVDPVRTWMAERNSGCSGIAADIVDAPLADGPFHIDPARRDASGRRAWTFDDLMPPPETWRRFIEHRAARGWGGLIKLGPGLDLAEAQWWFPEATVEIVSENGTLVQGLLRFGSMRFGDRSRHATLVMGRAEDIDGVRWATLSGEPDGELPTHSSAFETARYVYEPDDSAERAGLLGVLCDQVGAVMLHPRVGLLTSDTTIASPWLTGFEVLAEMPWNERRVKAALEERGAGTVEVKTRGGTVETDATQAVLRGKGEARLTVFVLRMGSAVRAIIGRRME